MDEQLMEAYRNTSFIADTLRGRLCIRVGQECRELDRFLADKNVGTWAYVTAFNPGSKMLSAQENHERQSQLEGKLHLLGHPVFAGEGVGDDGRWPPEPSLLVLGIARAAALRLGREFGQAAVVYGEIGEEAELLRCE